MTQGATVTPLHRFLLLGLLWLVTGCDRQSGTQALDYRSQPHAVSAPVYRLAVHPLHNPQKLYDAYGPLVDYLNQHLSGVRIELEASRDYPAFERKYRERAPAILLPNPWQTIQAQREGYRVIAMAGDAQDFKGIFIVRKGSAIKEPADLKGSVVSYPSPTALAAAIMPQYFLHTRGIDVGRDIQNVYVGSQESSIMNVYLGKSSVGATWPPPWRLFRKDHPQEAAQLRVIWETAALINNSVMVRDDVSPAVSAAIKDLLIHLDESPAGKAILAGMETARFHDANDKSYDVVVHYIRRFEHEVRPVEQE